MQKKPDPRRCAELTYCPKFSSGEQITKRLDVEALKFSRETRITRGSHVCSQTQVFPFVRHINRGFIAAIIHISSNGEFDF